MPQLFDCVKSLHFRKILGKEPHVFLTFWGGEVLVSRNSRTALWRSATADLWKVLNHEIAHGIVKRDFITRFNIPIGNKVVGSTLSVILNATVGGAIMIR